DWGETHEALRLDRAEPTHCPDVHGRKGHRDAQADRRPARRRKPPGRASEAKPAWPDAHPRARRRQLALRDHRDLRISRGEAALACDDRFDAGTAPRMPDVAR